MRKYIELTCLKCDEKWVAAFDKECGFLNFVNDDQAYCPECESEEYEIGAEVSANEYIPKRDPEFERSMDLMDKHITNANIYTEQIYKKASNQ